MSITQNTTCLVAELLSCLREMQMRKNDSSACYVMNVSLCIGRFINVQSWNKALHLEERNRFFYHECFTYCGAVWGLDFTLNL